MTIQEITKRNYEATVRRGQINNQTHVGNFSNKLHEELTELQLTLSVSQINPFDIKELADIALVCFAMAQHFGYDLVSEMEKKMLYNEKRED